MEAKTWLHDDQDAGCNAKQAHPIEGFGAASAAVVGTNRLNYSDWFAIPRVAY